MKKLSFFISAALLACSASAANVNSSKKFPDHSLVIIGGGLKTCSSISSRYCSEADLFSASARSADVYAVNAEHLANVADKAFWREERIIEQQQTLALLEYVRTKVGAELLTERDLLRMWRSAEIEIDGLWVSGRANYSALTERERQFVLDQLQVLDAAENGRGSKAKRKKAYADLSHTKDGFTVEIYQKVVELAQQVAGTQRKPRILLVTAAERDPFASVDIYTNLFEEAGAEVSWLALNAAYQAAQHTLVNDKTSCEQMPQYLAALHGTYQRERVYPDLMQQQMAFCKAGTEGAVEQLRRADAVFITGTDPSLALQAFRQPDGTATAELKQIESMLGAGQIIVAADAGGAIALSGGSYQGKKTPMLTNGDSYNAIQFGAFDLPAPEAGCDNDQSCSNGLAENHLTFNGQGGLGLFPWGVLDTQFSERSRQGRLIRLQHDTQTRYGFGIDENTALLVSLSKDETAPEAVMTVFGEHGVFVADIEKATSSGEGAATAISAVSTHYLTREDKIEIKDGSLRTRFAQWKFSPNNTLSPMLTSSELFERDNYRQLAQLLCTTQSRQADAKAVRVGLGHKFSLYKDASSYTRQGTHRHNGVDMQYCSYRNIMLDIQPVN